MLLALIKPAGEAFQAGSPACQGEVERSWGRSLPAPSPGAAGKVPAHHQIGRASPSPNLWVKLRSLLRERLTGGDPAQTRATGCAGVWYEESAMCGGRKAGAGLGSCPVSLGGRPCLCREAPASAASCCRRFF